MHVSGTHSLWSKVVGPPLPGRLGRWTLGITESALAQTGWGLRVPELHLVPQFTSFSFYRKGKDWNSVSLLFTFCLLALKVKMVAPHYIYALKKFKTFL